MEAISFKPDSSEKNNNEPLEPISSNEEEEEWEVVYGKEVEGKVTDEQLAAAIQSAKIKKRNQILANVAIGAVSVAVGTAAGVATVLLAPASLGVGAAAAGGALAMAKAATVAGGTAAAGTGAVAVGSGTTILAAAGAVGGSTAVVTGTVGSLAAAGLGTGAGVGSGAVVVSGPLLGGTLGGGGGGIALAAKSAGVAALAGRGTALLTEGGIRVGGRATVVAAEAIGSVTSRTAVAASGALLTTGAAATGVGGTVVVATTIAVSVRNAKDVYETVKYVVSEIGSWSAVLAGITETSPKLYQVLKELMPKEQDNSPAPQPPHLLPFYKAALQVGRPLGNVLLVVSGQSEDQISSTLAALFGDPTFLNSEITGECEYTLLSKELSIEDKGGDDKISAKFNIGKFVGSNRSSVETRMGLVDGFLEAARSTIMKIPEKTSSEYTAIIKAAAAADGGVFAHRDVVYPNLVLALVHLTSDVEEMEAAFANSLESLKGAVDRTNPNLVIVITNCMQLGKGESPAFEENLLEFEAHVKRIGKDVLDIPNLPVVATEISPPGWSPMAQGGAGGPQFYKLPNGDSSHLNLRKRIRHSLKTNGDSLGLLLTTRYFGTRVEGKNEEYIVVDELSHLT